MIYTLDTSSASAVVTSLLSGLNNSGILNQTLYQSGGTVVFTTNRSAKVHKLVVGGDVTKHPNWYYGDSHTGGGNLSGQVTISTCGSETWANWWLVTGPVAWAVVMKAPATSRYGTFFFSKAGTNEVMGALDEGVFSSASVRWVPTGVAIYLTGAPYCGTFALKTGDGAYYYTVPVIGVDSTYRLLFNGLSDLVWLCRDRGYVSGLEVYGDDVVLTGGTPDLPGTWVSPVLYFPGAATWTP